MAEDRMFSDEILLGLIKKNGGGGGGTTNYNLLSNKPQINSMELSGNKSLSDLGIASAQSVSNITNGESINDFAGVETALDGVGTALATKQNATDNSLETDAKTIVGAINEHEGDISSLKSGLTNLDNEVNGDATTYPYADVITIEDAVPSNLADCNVKIEPVQDLHGYDKPWVGGAGKNKLPMTVDGIKALNTSGTWTGNTYTQNTCSFELMTDSDGNITGIKVIAENPTTDSLSFIITDSLPLVNNETYYLSGCFSSARNRSLVLKKGTSWVAQNTNQNNASYTADDNFNAVVTIQISNGVSLNDVFLPMVSTDSEATYATFAPYTNLCPISGHTEVDVQRDGKNILDVSTYTANKYLGASGDEIDANSYAISKFIRVKPSTKYVASGVSSVNGTYMAFYDADKNFLSSMAETADGFSFTTPNNASYVKLSLRNVTQNAPQLEEGQTATPYEPYQGKTYTIQLGDTIYGGTVDFDSGVMTVDRAIDTLTSLNRTNDHSFYKPPTTQAETGQTTIDKVLCDRLPTGNNEAEDSLFINNSGNVRINTTQAFSTAEEVMAYLGGSYTLTYRIATPFTVQLTPQQIQLLKGTNTLTASTGQISVTVNGVSGSIGSVQEQVNELAEDVAEIKPLNYSTTEQKTGQKWIDGKDIYIKTISLAESDFTKTNNWFWQKDIEPLITGYETIVKIYGAAIIEFDGSKHLLPFGSELYNVNNSDKCIKFANYYRNVIIKGTPYNDSDINFATKKLAIVKCNITVAYTKSTT